MAKIVYDVLDEHFFQKTAYQYRLSLSITPSSCTYLLYDDTQWLAYRSYALEGQNRDLFSLKDEIETIRYQDKMLHLDFKSVDIYLLSEIFTFVPSAMYDDGRAATYLANITPNPINDIIKNDAFSQKGFYNVYAVKVDLFDFFKKQFPKAIIRHGLSHLLDYYSSHAEHRGGKKLYLNFHQNQLQITHFDESNFVYANNFAFQTSNDASYYTMLVVNQLGLNPETVEVYLTGHIDRNSELFNGISRYLRQINFMDTTITHQANSPFEEYSGHTFIDMLG